ncbi:unnamed protein product [Caenorhabditis angaria]|uniref:AB hydrolase-1 domain-containing protein n=1 Tax=Caenorhabditis angaria TaxID=860376 RepID=A0A9P1J3T1_9PELO|nr:unnamed protein product [Caenorhabditis angaria]
MLNYRVIQTINGLPKIFVRMASENGTKKPVRSKYFDLNEFLKKVSVTYKAGKTLEKSNTVMAGYIEIGDVKTSRATVVGLPGSPGSHNDFKYMKEFFEQKNIRLVCFNWPGSEFTPGGIENGYYNHERNSYAKAVLEKLDVKNCNRIIVCGHSRGGENALQLANILAADNWPVIGAALLNSPGFESHQGIRKRMGVIEFLGNLIKLNSRLINYFLHPLLDYFYNKIVGLRVANGAVAAAAILPLRTFAFDEQAKSIDEVRTYPNVKTFYGFGAKDFLIETHISDEFAAAFIGSDHYIIHDKTESAATIPKAKQSYLSGKQFVTANFTEEGHYLQKTYPEFIIEIIDAMVQVDEQKQQQEST